MIIEVPTSEDFRESGLSLLNLAWDTVSTLYLDLENMAAQEVDDDEFWDLAQRPLANAVSLAQQGVEFLLKARIVEVSPFLLIASQPRDWPALSAQEDTPFSSFRAIDAQDLIKIHDTVRSDRIDPAFRQRFDELRNLRNAIMHTVDKGLRHSPSELWVRVLDASHHLIGPCKWIGFRRTYLNYVPTALFYAPDSVDWQMCWEAELLLKTLKPTQARLFLGVAPRQRFYMCYPCTVTCSSYDLYPKSAQLRPNTPTSTRIYCFVCDKEDTVVRRPCPRSQCPGNVIQKEDSVCLTCYDM